MDTDKTTQKIIELVRNQKANIYDYPELNHFELTFRTECNIEDQVFEENKFGIRRFCYYRTGFSLQFSNLLDLIRFCKEFNVDCQIEKEQKLCEKEMEVAIKNKERIDYIAKLLKE